MTLLSLSSLLAGGARASRAAAPSSREATEEAVSLVKFGLVEQSKGQGDRALKYFSQAAAVAPDYGPAYSNRANVLVLFGRLEEALRDYDAAVATASGGGEHRKKRVCFG